MKLIINLPVWEETPVVDTPVLEFKVTNIYTEQEVLKEILFWPIWEDPLNHVLSKRKRISHARLAVCLGSDLDGGTVFCTWYVTSPTLWVAVTARLEAASRVCKLLEGLNIHVHTLKKVTHTAPHCFFMFEYVGVLLSKYM